MKYSNKALIKMGWKILAGWNLYHHHNAVKHFESVMEELDKNPPSAEQVIIAYYDYYKTNSHVPWNLRYGVEVRDKLFQVFEIEPKEKGCWAKLWANSWEDAKYESKSLKGSIKKLDKIVDKIKHPEQEKIAEIRPI